MRIRKSKERQHKHGVIIKKIPQKVTSFQLVPRDINYVETLPVQQE